MTVRTFALTDLPERIRAHTAMAENACWHWTGKLDKGGYGETHYRVGPSVPVPESRASSRGWGYGQKKWRLSRLVWTLLFGVIPEGMQVGHACHDLDPSCAGGPTCLHRRCLNPAHLTVQSGETNRAMAQRFPRPRNHDAATSNAETSNAETFKTGTCPKGHDVSHPDEQVYVYPSGRHMCRTCHYISRFGHPP